MREATESRRYRCGRRGRSCPGSRHGHGRDRGTRTLPAEHGDEQAALDSVYKLFGVTRETIKRHGPGCRGFTKIAIVVLNQVIRPFTARWHRESLAGAFTDKARCKVFRRELDDLQDKLLRYTKMLGDMAGVEDLTELENGEPSVRQFQERADFAHHVDSPTPPAEPAKALRKLEGGAHQERLQPEQPHRGRGGRRDDLDNAQIATNDPSSS